MVKYKLYKNKSSLQQRNSRMLQGGDADIIGKKIGWWERKLSSPNVNQYFLVELDITTNKRPDLLSTQYYDTPAYDWIILQYNNIVDITEEFVIGKEIKMPTLSFIHGFVLNNSVRGMYE